MKITKSRRKVGLSLAVLGAGVAIVLGVTSLGTTVAEALYNSKTENNYSLTLNSSNKVTTDGDFIRKTARGGEVTFTYAGVANSTTGHATLNTNGTITNKDQITSITSFTATYSGAGVLKARIAYVTNKWSEYFILESGKEVETGSNPYFLEMKAFDGAVTLSTAVYKFSCTTNPAAQEQDTSGHYDITFSTHSSDGSGELSYSTLSNEVASGSQYISSFDDVYKIFPGASGLKFASNNYEGTLTINFSSQTVTNQITTVDISTAQYSNKSSYFKVYVNDSSSYTQITPSAGGTVTVNGTLSSLTFETVGKQAYLCGLTLNYGGHTEPGTPDNPAPYVVGFSANDANKNEYTTNSVFAASNALSVRANYSDGSTVQLTSSQYSYQILNSSSVAINPSEKFPAEGIYTLVVTYGNYIPIEIELNVGEYVYITDVSASMTTTTFNTADTLSAHLAGNLTANLEFSNDTIGSDIAYGDFAANGIAVRLITPKGITYDQTKPFGTAGNWTVKVYSVDDEEMYYDIALTINAIPVQTITLNETSYELYPEDTLQLVATVNPTNATNDSVVWASNNESVATVDESGLVTAVAVGGATITATAADGTNVYGACSITVVAAPVVVDHDATMTAGTNASECTINNDINGIKVGTGKASGDMTVTVPAGAVKLSFYAAGWNNSSGNMTLSGVTAATSSFNLTSDSGINGNSPFTLSGNVSDYYYETALSNVTSETEITFERDNRFVMWDAKYYTNQAPVTPIYPTAIGLTAPASSITIGQTTQLTVTYTPSDTNVKNVTFSSSNENIATVSSAGLITGVAQGSATITATAEAASGTVSNTFGITVTPVSVTSVSLDTNSTSVKVGKTVTLVATVNPSNATNKNINWSSNATSVATVNSSGVVTGVAAGTATITATSAADSSKKATCVVSVTASGGEETFDITYTDLPSTYQTGLSVYTADSGIKFQAYNCANYSSKVQFKASSGYLQNTEDLELQSVTINDRESNTLTVYGSNTAGSFSTEITGTNDVYDLTGYSYFKIARTASGAAYCSSITVVTGTPTPTDPTSIIMSSTSAEVGIGGSKQLSVSYVPSNANQNKQVTWTSSNTNVATVSSDGLVSVKSTASAGQTATITARLTNITSIYATCTITVIEQAKDDSTVLIYLCGADLESNNSLATGDIQEILKVNGQPDDVNIVIETGGASSWASTYGISSSKLERWHVENKSLVKDASLTYASMGLTSTLQSFLEYGLNNYPAERTSLILWNHGGGMHGVCYDEKKSDDSLLDNEVKSAVSGALSNCGMSGQKLEWIGYDACLMQVQDIAEMNSPYFKYMVASEESEAGYGWDYDNWVDDLYAKKDTTVILKAICDTFISDNGGVNSSSGDQTLSYLDLSKASAYKTAWEAMAGQLQSKLTSSNKGTFNTAIINNVKHFADSDYDYFCLFDAKDFINKLSSSSAFSSFRIDASYTNAVLSAFSDLVVYSTAQKGAGNAFGLCMYWCNNSTYSDMSVYTTSHTNFTTWRSINNTYGTHK